jgi:hypothetical protein
MGSVLRIWGENFNVTEYLKTNKLKPFKIYYKDEPVNKLKPEGIKHNSSGFLIATTKSSFDNLDFQVKETIRFLKRNLKYLEPLSKDKSITESVLDFGINSRIDSGNGEMTQYDFFPSELLRLAGNLGFDICLSQYYETKEFKRELKKIIYKENKE